MSILLLPFKIVFLIIAFILKGILYLLAFILNFISEVLVALQYILGSIFVLIAIGGTVVLVKSIQNGSLTGLQGGVLIGVLWLISMAFSLMFYLSSAAADLFESIGDWLGDTTLRKNLCKFKNCDKSDILERLKNNRSNFFTVYNGYCNLSRFFGYQPAGMESG